MGPEALPADRVHSVVVKRRLSLLTPLALLLMVALAHSDSGAPILHEYVDVHGEQSQDRIVGADVPAAGKNPPAFRMGSRLLPAPSSATPAGQNEPVLGQSGFAVDRDTEEKPDRNTGADGTLHYAEIFNPSVVPFKRMSALDAVREDYTLVVGDPSLKPLSVGGQSVPDRDLFWGSTLVDFTPGKDIPLPSVAPDARILSYELDPPGKVDFFKDGADNFFVRSEVSGQHRLVFLTDAPASYFGQPIPAGLRFGDVPPGKVRPLPASVAHAAEDMFAIIGVSRDDPYDLALNKLIYWFRSFQAGTLSNQSGDIYLDIAKNQIGVCRHRSFAFQVTANALGIPARYVANEAHAWAEVFVPHIGWMRVDLGGAALALDVQGASGKTMHRPRDADSFPKPPAYSQQYTQLQGDIKGLTADQIADAQQGAQNGGPGGVGPGGHGPSSPMGSPDAGLPMQLVPGPVPSIPTPLTMTGARPTVIQATPVDLAGFRGEPARVKGQVVTMDTHEGVQGVRVEVYIRPLDHIGGTFFLGHTVTGADGTFELSAELPREAPLGEHEVVAVTPGNTKFGGSRTN